MLEFGLSGVVVSTRSSRGIEEVRGRGEDRAAGD
jgi:hypothetical protein